MAAHSGHAVWQSALRGLGGEYTGFASTVDLVGLPDTVKFQSKTANQGNQSSGSHDDGNNDEVINATGMNDDIIKAESVRKKALADLMELSVYGADADD